ncbi:MAG: DNA-binding protein WhiA [Lachnospiraceae bacterium]|nr:DNA-binding protein WhiA [Lachnospiraceae bacterium]
MSFSLNVKKELVSSIPNARHCRIAELAAVTAMSAVLRDGRIELSSENETVNECFSALFKKLTGKDYAGDTGELLKLLKLQDGLVPNRVVVQQTCCKRAFLKGAFIACGSISDPEKDYHLEFVLDDAEKAALTAELITSFGIETKIVNRKKYNVVYLKDGEHIVDVLNIMGAHVSLMELENVRIVKEMRNSINRRVNCEAANIGKTIAAATRQIEDIQFLNDTVGLDSLSDELRTTALLRLEFPDASLAELGEKHDRRVGRSGVNHRLQKLSDMAERLRSGKPG